MPAGPLLNASPSWTAVSCRPGRSNHAALAQALSPHIDDTFIDKIIMPGLIDPHTHFAFSAGYLAMHYIGPIDSPGPHGINPGLATRPEVIAKLREADKSDSDPPRP